MLIEDNKINYNGLKAPILTWDHAEYFNPPRKMLVAVDHLDYAQVANVYAYDPAAKSSVITDKGAFKYCADIPQWNFEAVCDYITGHVKGIVVKEGALLYYDGHGRNVDDAARNIVANGMCIYPKWYEADTQISDTHITYDEMKGEDVEELVKAIRRYHESMNERATQIELAEWLAKGNGMMRCTAGNECFTAYVPVLGKFHTPVANDIRIYSWETQEWTEPTLPNMKMERRK
jgi:hypothetical protein